MMGSSRCPNCCEAIVSGSSFCHTCGDSLTSTTTYAAPTTFSRLVPQFSGNGYIVEQKILALRDTFGIKDRNGNQLAYVKKQLVSFGPKFWYETPDGQRLGEIHGKVLAIRPTFEVYDSQGQLLAQVKKKLMKLIGQAWWMEDPTGQEIAKINGNVWAHDCYIQNMAGQLIGHIHKKWVSVRDSYRIEML